MNKFIIKFDLICLDDKEFIVDPNSIYIDGYFKWHMVNEFLFVKEFSQQTDMRLTWLSIPENAEVTHPESKP